MGNPKFPNRINSISKPELKTMMAKKLPTINDPDFATFNAGVEEGKRITRHDVLTQLQTQYMSDEVVRNSPEALLILKIAGELKRFIDGL